MTLAVAIAAESESVEFTRHAAGTRVKGIYTPGGTSTFTALFAVQPMSTRELQMLPEGERVRGRLKMYGTTELQVASPSTDRLGDRFTRQGVLWEVVGEDMWSGNGGHYRYQAAKVEA